jgi:hypothetical protein
MPPASGIEPEVPLPLDNDWLVTPVNAAALSLRLCGPLPVSGEMLSTSWKGAMLLALYLVVREPDDPPLKRSKSDFTVLASGEINQMLPALLPPLLEDFVDVFV